MMTCLGPCGREVALTNSDGWCAKCVQEEARLRAQEQTAGVVADNNSIDGLCSRGCGNKPHRGSCKGKNNRRKPASNEAGTPLFTPPAKGRTRMPRKASNEAGERAKIETLRGLVQEEFDRVEHEYARLRVKLETFDEILAALE